MCVGVYKRFRIGKKKMSGRRVAAACDRRQLPRGMGSMAAPLLDPRPLRLPFLEADVSRTRGGDGLCWVRVLGRARPGSSARRFIPSPCTSPCLGSGVWRKRRSGALRLRHKRSPGLPPRPVGAGPAPLPRPRSRPERGSAASAKAALPPERGMGAGRGIPATGERGMDPRDPRKGSNGESEPRDPCKGEWGAGPPERGGMARRDPRKGGEWTRGMGSGTPGRANGEKNPGISSRGGKWGAEPPGPPKRDRGSGPRDPPRPTGERG